MLALLFSIVGSRIILLYSLLFSIVASRIIQPKTETTTRWCTGKQGQAFSESLLDRQGENLQT
jgi:hypothetical protein